MQGQEASEDWVQAPPQSRHPRRHWVDPKSEQINRAAGEGAGLTQPMQVPYLLLIWSSKPCQERSQITTMSASLTTTTKKNHIILLVLFRQSC